MPTQGLDNTPSGDFMHRHGAAGTSIKKNDAEPLTRNDIQYDLLNCIFTDPILAFDDQSHLFPNSGRHPMKVNFRDLYVNALLQSTKLSGVIKDKMLENKLFADEFAKIALLINIGRINTTMAFFPDMKTALRTYHPIPSLQKTDGNVQDAPRIKNALKGAYLPSEIKGARSNTPAEVLARCRAGQIPPCSVTNLVFIFFNHAADVSLAHFKPPLDPIDLFFPIPLSSASRARAFLWLVFHYLSGADASNPFSENTPGQLTRMPELHNVSEEEATNQNLDTEEEHEFGERMRLRRSKFLQNLIKDEERIKKGPEEAESAASPAPTRAPPPAAPRRRAAPRGSRSASKESSVSRSTAHEPKPSTLRTRQVNPAPTPLVVHQPPPPPPPQVIYHERPPLPLAYPYASDSERTMVQQAWHNVVTTDPLLDSDEENADIHVRNDYVRRLSVISRLRGRPPTPDPVYDANAMQGIDR